MNKFVLSSLFFIVIFLAGCTQQTTVSKFSLKDINFDLISTSWTDKGVGLGNIETSLRDQCNAYQCYKQGWNKVGCPPPVTWQQSYQNAPFTMTINIKDVPNDALVGNNLKTPLECYGIFDNVQYKWDFRISNTGIQNFESTRFCSNPVNGRCGANDMAYFDITKQHAITLCCDEICKTQTLNVYCN